MEERKRILEAIHEDSGFEDNEDAEMADLEEGELVEENLPAISRLSISGDAIIANLGCESNKCTKKMKKKKKKKKRKHRGGSEPDVTNINRFVVETCRRLKEKKSYMVYAAVGCLGLSALNDFVKEVDAIQACGGQMTVDGRRNRSGGGILWNIIKARAPTGYQEIMKKTKEFEKQFRQQNIKVTRHNKEGSSTSTAGTTAGVLESTSLMLDNKHEQPVTEGNRKPVHERIRVPVSYDDLLGDDSKNNPT